MDTLSKFSLPIILFLLTIAFGLWVSKVGKPYNGALFNIHKLIALGAVVLAVIQLSKLGVVGSPLLVVPLILAGLCAIALFASGALMSMDKLPYTLTLSIHRIAPVLLVIATGTAAYLLIASPALVK
jgi:hypothetical protein